MIRSCRGQSYRLLAIDDTRQVYIRDDGIDRLRELLDDLEIPEDVEGSPLAVVRVCAEHLLIVWCEFSGGGGVRGEKS